MLPDRQRQSCYVLGPVLATGKSIGSTSTIYDSTSSQWATQVHFKNNDFITKIAQPLVGKNVAIELDGIVQSAPTIQPNITGRDVEITGNFTQGEASQLSLVLRYGALPVQFDPHKQTIESVSPTLGRDQLTAGIVSGLIGLGLVARLHAVVLPIARVGRARRARAHRRARSTRSFRISLRHTD